MGLRYISIIDLGRQRRTGRILLIFAILYLGVYDLIPLAKSHASNEEPDTSEVLSGFINGSGKKKQLSAAETSPQLELLDRSVYERYFPMNPFDLGRGKDYTVLTDSHSDKDDPQSEFLENLQGYLNLFSTGNERTDSDYTSTTAGMILNLSKWKTRLGLEILQELSSPRSKAAILKLDSNPMKNHRFRLGVQYYDYKFTAYRNSDSESWSVNFQHSFDLPCKPGIIDHHQIWTTLEHNNRWSRNIITIYDPIISGYYHISEGGREVELNTASLGYGFGVTDKLGQTTLALQVTRSIMGNLRSDTSQQNPERNPDLHWLIFRAQRSWNLPFNWRLDLDLELQASDSTLPSYEYFDLQQYGRVRGAFTDNTSSADSGGCVSLELRMPTQSWSWLDKISGGDEIASQAYWLLFYDIGLTQFQNPIIGLNNYSEFQSTGVGLRINKSEKFSVDLDLMYATQNDYWNDDGFLSFRISSTVMF